MAVAILLGGVYDAGRVEVKLKTKNRTSRRLIQQACIATALLLCLQPAAYAERFINQAQSETKQFESGRPVEREIAGGESHTYQIALTGGQFVRFRLDQRAIDAALILSAPDGKQLVEMNLTGAGEQESLSMEAAAPGSYRLTVRGSGAATLRGSYRLEAEVQAKALAQDRKRLAAEALLVEASELRKQGAKTAQQVIEKIQQALPVWRELGEPFWTSYSLYLIGSAYCDLSQFGKAIEYLEQTLAITREVKLRAREAEALYGLGLDYYSLSRYEKAIEYSEQALAIYRELKNRGSEGDALNILGLAHNFLGRTDKTIEYYEQALAIAREVKDRQSEAIVLANLGGAYNRLGRNEKAIEYHEEALAIAREVKDRQNEARMLSTLGNIYMVLGRTEKAIEYSEQALAIAREVKLRPLEGSVLSNLGIVYTVLSRYEKAIEYYEQALAILREVKSRQSEGTALLNLGIAYSWLGRKEKAIEYLEQALAIYRDLKARRGEGVALGNLGAANNSLGRPENAIEYYEQALAIAREVKNRGSEGNLLLGVGNAHTSLGRPEKAIEYYEQSLAIAREVKNRLSEEEALNDMGGAYRSLGRLDVAVRYHEQALLVARELKAQAREAEALTQLAIDERNRGNLARARTLIEESLGIAESLRTGVVSTESRAGFLASVQSSYQLYTDLLMRQHQAEPTKGFDAMAVEVSERQRARSLLDLLTEAHADVRQGVDAALLERERLLGRQLNDEAQRLTQASDPKQADALKQEISRLETDYERAQADIRKASPHYAALTQPQPLKLKEIQQQLDADTLLLEYSLGEERSYLWAITKDSLTSYELPKGEQIKQSALHVYELLTARSTSKRGESTLQRRDRIAQSEANLPAAAQSLSQTLLAPVAAEIGNKRLVIVAEGALQYIPFAMLPEPVVSGQWPVASEKKSGHRPLTTDHRPLIVSHEIVSLPSASALAIQRAELTGRPLAPKMLAVIADPVFDRTDVRFTTPLTEASDKTQPQTIAANSERTLEHLAEQSDDKAGVATRRLMIPRLPFTRREADQVLALTTKTSSFRAVDFQASRATVLDPGLSQYRYVHFATHGFLDSERPGLSALVLSMVDEQGKPQDGFLRANDIYNLKLPAELVVLSACQTGLGKDIKGEGLVGLTRGFMYAGAARVVVSLWSVNDKATAELMAKFYEKMLKQGERPAAALRAAQVEMWKQKQWQSPYYWAAFTMQGEWK